MASQQETRPEQPAENENSSFGWISSFANSAYSAVVGAPESYRDLQPDESTSTNGTALADVDPESRQALWKQLGSYVGMDVMNKRLSLPVWLFEPTTSLSRMVETFQFSDLLDRAAASDDPVLRDCLVAAFVVSAFAHTERVKKPFNPLLGETYEYINPVNDMKFYAEQVSHHPPISVSRCEGKGWIAGEVVDIKAQFQGNSIEISNIGNRYIHLVDTNDRYSWSLPKAHVSNLFVGGSFVDHFGTIELHNQTTNTVATLELTKCGWFSSGRYEVIGDLVDPAGEKIVTFKGFWNKYLDCERVAKAKGEGANRLWMAGSHMLPEEEGGSETGPFANWTKFTKRALSLDSDYTQELPPTDSRLRPDRMALEKGDNVKAADEKVRLEQLQRDRQQEEQNTEGKWTPRYFKRMSDDKQLWEPIGNYWAESRTFTGEKRENTALW